MPALAYYSHLLFTDNGSFTHRIRPLLCPTSHSLCPPVTPSTAVTTSFWQAETRRHAVSVALGYLHFYLALVGDVRVGQLQEPAGSARQCGLNHGEFKPHQATPGERGKTPMDKYRSSFYPASPKSLSGACVVLEPLYCAWLSPSDRLRLIYILDLECRGSPYFCCIHGQIND